MRVWLQHLNELEGPFCVAWTRKTHGRWMRRFFALISRLGNGVFWYSLIAVLPVVDGWDGFWAGLHMLGVGGVALLLYKTLKGVTRRDRPCHHELGIVAGAPPLDRYSFPSGHTLHAVGFSTVALFYYPQLALLLVPFTGLVAASRVVLGLHYPSDVLVASVIGLGLAYASIQLVA